MKKELIERLKKIFGKKMKTVKIKPDPNLQKDASEFISILEEARKNVQNSKIVFK